MKFQAIKNVVTSKVGRQVLTLQKHSPTVLFGAGVVGVAATVVLACRATLKVEEILIDHQQTIKDINSLEHVEYTEENRTQDKIVLYIKTAMHLTKLYGPALTIGMASIACLTGSHHIMSQRNAGLMAAYTALEKGFDQYRKRVLDDVGADKDREYRYGTETREFVEDTKNGPKVVREDRADTENVSGYAKLFGRDTSTSWNATAEYNLLFLKSQQNFMNDLLRTRGHVMLNDVYDALGLDRTKAGAVVGWLKDSDGDNYVDFGIFDRDMAPRHLDFFTGREDAILIDFNVDGVIYDKL